jgi:mannosylglucosylglycerate synthase
VSTCALVSFRLGGTDGVSIEAAKWAGALSQLGFQVTTVAGSGQADHLLPGLALDASAPPTIPDLTAALDADLVIVENICSLPLNLAASEAIATVLTGRPAVLHHHDLSWQRPHLSHLGPPPTDPRWAHVTINQVSTQQLAQHGIKATTIYNTFDPDPPPGNRDLMRADLDIDPGMRLVLQPTRALERKNIPEGIALATALHGTYWLLGPAEDGYGPALANVVRDASCPIRLGVPRRRGTPTAAYTIDDAYAACDVVTLPSSWEGFGNPTVESATHDRPLAVGHYPVAKELERFGFRWFASDQPAALHRWFDGSDRDLIRHNHDVARQHFNVHHLSNRLSPVLEEVITLPRRNGSS